jgi:hypothetical protein
LFLFCTSSRFSHASFMNVICTYRVMCAVRCGTYIMFDSFSIRLLILRSHSGRRLWCLWCAIRCIFWSHEGHQGPEITTRITTLYIVNHPRRYEKKAPNQNTVSCLLYSHPFPSQDRSRVDLWKRVLPANLGRVGG